MAFVDDDPDEAGKLAEVDEVGGICPTDDLEDPGPLCLDGLLVDDGVDEPGSLDTEDVTGTLDDTTTVVGEEVFVAAIAYAHVLATALKFSVHVVDDI